MPEVGSITRIRKLSAVIADAKTVAPLASVLASLGRIVRTNLLKAGISSLAVFAAAPAFAQGVEGSPRITLPFLGTSVGAFEVIQFSMFLGAMGAALLSAGWLIRDRSRIAAENDALREKFGEMSLVAKRNDALLNFTDQRVIVWDSHSARADVVGQLPRECGVPEDRSGFLAFGLWLRPQSVAELEHAIENLRQTAQAFDLTVETGNGTLIGVQGRTSGALAIVRFCSLQGVQAKCAALELQNREYLKKLDLLRHLLEKLDQPVWARDAQGRIEWVNSAYAHAVDMTDAGVAAAEGRELFSAQTRQRLERDRLAEPDLHEQLPAVVRGDRRIFDVTDVSSDVGSVGIGIDLSEAERIRDELQRTLKSHSETLDQLSTAVAIFDPDMKLQFFNQAFVKLWSLDVAWLETQPSNTLLFDRLRSEGKLPEQPEWRKWKDSMLSAYRAVEPQEHMWHLPDTRIMRVVANPHPQGGVTWFFENMTEKFELESRYNTLIRMQGETLDHLEEAVAVFGSDGRLRLSNPSFADIWSLPTSMVGEGTHISTIAKLCSQRGGNGLWNEFVSKVAGFNDKRDGSSGQVELDDGVVLSYALVPLPKGQTMLTFIDVTDTMRVQKALQEKNEALELADQIKNDFVQHVSYELRSPLTNIIGFTELLQTPAFGSLNERQLEYLDHISTSSQVLLTIVNDILDLATVDAGIMELEYSDVSVPEVISAAAARVSERMRDHNIALDVDIESDVGVFKADANRVRQILFNLLSNAANYAPEGSTVSLQVMREGNDTVFAVHDDGPGMPEDVLDTVFKRFQSYANGGRRRGAGLGLAIVKSFVELHGGSVEIETGEGRGTTVICRFPSEARSFRAAAE
ncbi:PAS-domain containing protein [Daeguia caeni]|uniref:histidine kinase n=1 Tax=Daeguia caeni TaxID=439612 RepID=A0ABV9H6A2_9HYPH